MMTAFEAMGSVLDTNEMVEWLKTQNMGNTPNLEYCKIVKLLTDYRELLVQVMENTELCVGSKE